MIGKNYMDRLGKFHCARQLSSDRGNPVANQFVLEFQNGLVFQSYRSVVCIRFLDGQSPNVVLGANYDYSRTTRKYLYKFLRDECGFEVYGRNDLDENWPVDLMLV